MMARALAFCARSKRRTRWVAIGGDSAECVNHNAYGLFRDVARLEQSQSKRIGVLHAMHFRFEMSEPSPHQSIAKALMVIAKRPGSELRYQGMYQGSYGQATFRPVRDKF